MQAVSFGSYLVDHVRQQTLHLIVFQPSIFRFAAQPNRCSKLGNRDSGPAYRWSSFLFCGNKSSGEEDLPKQVSQCDVTAALECKVDATLDKLILTSGESGVEAGQIGASNATGQWGEEGAETWIGVQKLGGRERMSC